MSDLRPDVAGELIALLLPLRTPSFNLVKRGAKGRQAGSKQYNIAFDDTPNEQIDGSPCLDQWELRNDKPPNAG